MRIGILDLVLIYCIPIVFLGILAASFFVVLYLVVKWGMDTNPFSEDVRYNLQLKKRPVTFGTVVQVFLFDTGVQAAFFYRLSRFLYLRGFKTLAAIIHKQSKFFTNVDLPPTAKIGPGVVFLHCCNIVINPYVDIGKHVIIRPWVGLRGWGTVKIEDGVRIGWLSGVVDCVTMGKDSESGPGSIVTQDVPAGHIAYGVPAKRFVPKPKTKLRGVILELENVLMDPTPMMDEALRATLDRAGKRMGKSQANKMDHLPPAILIQNQFSRDPAGRVKALSDYIGAVRTNLQATAKLRSHARELLAKLRDRGLKTAVISRQPDALVKEMLESLQVNPLLDFWCGSDEFLTEWKPQPWIVYRPMRALKLGVERVIYLAGSRQDLRAGIEAAVRVYWVPFSDNVPSPPRGLVDRFKDLEQVLEEFSKPDLPVTF